jgi:arginase
MQRALSLTRCGLSLAGRRHVGMNTSALAQQPPVVAAALSMPVPAVKAMACSSLSSTSAASSQSLNHKRGVASLSRTRDGLHPLYSSEQADQDPSRFIFSRYIAAPKVAAIIGAPMALGQPQIGVDQGPAYIRSAGLRARLEADSWTIEDAGDVDLANCAEDGRVAAQATLPPGSPAVKDSPDALNSLAVGHANYLVYKAAVERAKKGQFVLLLGGDHSIAVGSIAAVLSARPDASILWVDAHADINPPRASGSKNIHGMVLSFLMDIDGCRNTIPGFEWLDREGVPRLDPSRLVYVGLRDVDWAEKQLIKSLNIRAFSMMDVDRLGMAAVVHDALDHLSQQGRVPRPLHLTFDIDSIDPLYAPSTGTRVSGGLTYREAYFLCEAAAESNALVSMDLVEVNPAINEQGKDQTVGMAVRLCASAMGNRIL